MKVILALLMASIMVAAMIAPAMGNNTDTSATVGNVDPVVVSVTVADPGSMNLCTLGNTDVIVTATVSDANGVADIASVNITAISPTISITLPITMTTSTTTGTQAVYTGTISLPCCTSAGDYNVTVTATDTGSLSDTGTDTLTVPTSTGLSLDFDKVAFGPAAPNTIDVPGNATLNGTPESSPAVTNEGNTVINISVLAGNLSGNIDTIARDNMEADVTGDAEAWKVLNPATFYRNLGCSDLCIIDFRLDIPNVKPDTYTGILTISAV